MFYYIIYKVIVIVSSILIVLLILSITCVYDRAGKSFYQLKMIESRYRKDPLNMDAQMRNLKHRYNLYLLSIKFFRCCLIMLYYMDLNEDTRSIYITIAGKRDAIFYFVALNITTIKRRLPTLPKRFRLFFTNTTLCRQIYWPAYF